MTDSQTLLAEYTRSGSEGAFRKLVTRYLGLVYSTALRLVDGDTHLAEDVAQTVFIDLARKARGISSGVMLGGWLHQRTCNISRPMQRAARRRQIRETEAMNVLQNDDADSHANLARIAPILDEAITHLGKKDRTAIILRFFERRDFRSIGEALGSSEDAARMRVSRSLEKLRLLLKRQGIALSASALGTALATEAASAAPVGMAANLACIVLAHTAATDGIAATLFKIGTMTKFKTGFISAIVLIGLATSLVIQHKAQAESGAKQDSLRGQTGQLARLLADNERLSALVAQANRSVANAPLNELQELRAEAESLRAQTQELPALRLAQTARTPLQMSELGHRKQHVADTWIHAFIKYANQNQGQLPASFEQAEPFWPKEISKDNGVATDEFEILYHGSLDALTNKDVVVFREKNLWEYRNPDGSYKWGRHYGLASGRIDYCSSSDKSPTGSFYEYEKDHLVSQGSQ